MILNVIEVKTMTEVEITVRLPESLVKDAEAFGLLSSEHVERLLRAEIQAQVAESRNTSELRQLRSNIEEWRRKMLENAITDPDEILAYMKKMVDPNAPPYRLELFYDADSKTLLLQGNKTGLDNLSATLGRLVRSESASGAHAHYDSASGLSKNNVDLIIQLVDDIGAGAHTVPSAEEG
jgi:hypothetical protein